jgi:tRNA A-37 threonylcarbamoyl transferase component Bud32
MANDYQLTKAGSDLENYFLSFNREYFSKLTKISSSKNATIYFDEKNELVLKVYSDSRLAKKILNNYQYLVRNKIQHCFVKVYGLMELDDVSVIVMEKIKELTSKEYLQSISYDKQVLVTQKMTTSLKMINSKAFFHRDVAHFGNWFVRNDDILLIDFDSTTIEKYNLFKRLYFACDELYSFSQALIIIFGKKRGLNFAKIAVSKYTIFSFLLWPILKINLSYWVQKVKYLVIED